jgi:hypothetical protein
MKLVIGKTYKVNIEDCCVEGEFTSKLVEAYEYDDDENKVPVTIKDYNTNLIFENGVRLVAMNGVELKENRGGN